MFVAAVVGAAMFVVVVVGAAMLDPGKTCRGLWCVISKSCWFLEKSVEGSGCQQIRRR